MLRIVECNNCGVLTSVGKDATGAVCWECVVEGMQKDGTYQDGFQINKPKQTSASGYPKGWRFMKVFVHQDGTVYHRGVPQPSLKGTLTPTEVAEKPKKTKAQKREERATLLAEYGKIKKAYQKETRKTYKKKLEAKLKKLQKQI